MKETMVRFDCLGEGCRERCRWRARPSEAVPISLLPAARPAQHQLTFCCVATKKNGLEGWNSTRTTRPRFLRNGFWLAPLLSWCTSTAWRG